MYDYDYGSPSSSSGPSAYPRSGYDAHGGPSSSFYSSQPATSSYLPPFDYVDHDGYHPSAPRSPMGGSSSRYSHHSSRSYPPYHSDYHHNSRTHHGSSNSNHDLLASFLGGSSSSSSDHRGEGGGSGIAWPMDHPHRPSITPPTASSSGGGSSNHHSGGGDSGAGNWLDFLSGASGGGPPPHIVAPGQTNGGRGLGDLFPPVSGERRGIGGVGGKRDGPEGRRREMGSDTFDGGRGRDGAG